MSLNLKNRLIFDTIEHKKNHVLTFCVSSILFNSKSKPIGITHYNEPRNYCRGHMCASLHSEANSIISYFGKNINYTRKNGWTKYGKKTKFTKYNGG